MKRFLLQFSLFVVTAVVVLALVIAGTYGIVSSASFSIPEDKTILVVGDSQPECAIDDGIFSRAVNIAQGGTAYLYSYIKLKKFLGEDYHINRVLLSFHGDAIQKSSDVLIWEDKHILNKIPQFISLLHKEEVFLFKSKPSFFYAVAKIPACHIRYIFRYIFIPGLTLTYRDLYIGAYDKLDRDKLEEDIARMEKNTVLQEGRTTEQDNEYSRYQLDYLLKIVELCRNKNVELVLVNTPTYKSDKYGNKPALTNFYNTYLSGVKYLDCSDFPMPEYGYGDIGHLNYKGAEIFSRYLEDNYKSIFDAE